LIEQRHADAPDNEPSDEAKPALLNKSIEPGAWFNVLGVSPSATVDEVKQAYKVLLKQNHPDRVFNMSAAFRELAEGETKKLNTAYAEALTDLGRGDAWSDQEMTRTA
jgi:DnaJ-domain-containing protein 1